MAVDELVSLREIIEKYEKAKKNNFVLVLGNIRRFKANEDEEEVKEQLRAVTKMIPRILTVIDEELKKFEMFKEVTDKLKMQADFAEKLNTYANKYVNAPINDKNQLNEYYSRIYELMNKFIKFCDLIKESKLK
ncbi:hypothetical protein KY308_00355 [Candidatus Woesearchaeota archaeon]|nr:hypothetical protein [Candidatus Woesearchaeota archaeon]